MPKAKVVTVDGKILVAPSGKIYGCQNDVFEIEPSAGYGGTGVTITGENFTNSLDSYTKLLLRGDGTGAIFVDSSPVPKTGIQAYGSATQSATQSKFGGKSIFLNSATDYLTVPNSSDFEFGSGSFTVDWWEYRTSAVNNAVVLCRDSNSVTPFIIGYTNNEWQYAYMSSNGTSWDIASAKRMGFIRLNTWVHYALVRSGSNFYTFQNGALVDSWTSSAALKASTSALYVGRRGTGYNFSGYIDELRVSKGTARWVNPFTPPISAYSSVGVAFDSLSASNIVLANSTTITAAAPNHMGGDVDVSVTAGGEPLVVTGGFTYYSIPVLSGTPANPTAQKTTNVTVGGPGIVAYKYKLDAGVYSDETSVSTPIQLSGLADGSHTLYVIGKETSGIWNPEGQATTYTWYIASAVVTGSMLLHYDAGNPSSYPGSGSYWYDLSGNGRTATLYNGVSFSNGALNFNGSNQYASRGSVARIGAGFNGTVEVVSKGNGYIVTNHRVRGGSPCGDGHFITNQHLMQYGGNLSITHPYQYYMVNYMPAPTTSFCYRAAAVTIPTSSGTMTGTFLVNGLVQNKSASTPVDSLENFTTIEIGRWANAQWGTIYTAASVAIVRIYGRRLSEAELIQNFNYNRARFGL